MDTVINEFGNPIELGKSLDVLRKAKDYFWDRHGEQIIDYWFCHENGAYRTVAGLEKKLLRECCISGTNLYYIIEPEAGEGPLKVRQKRHLIFISASGKRLYTAYTFKRVLRKVGYTKEPSQLEQVPVPSLNEFLRITPKEFSNRKKQEYYEAAREDYSKIITPFVLKWRELSINKSNLIDFLTELEKVKKHLIYYGEGVKLEELNKEQVKFMDFLFRMIRIE